MRTATARPAHAAKDFYGELIQASQGRRAGLLAERLRWLRGLSVDGRDDLLFEFEMLLRAVERSFHLQDLGVGLADEAPAISRNFRAELMDVRDALDAAIRISRKLLEPDADQKMVFRRYVESILSDDRARSALRDSELDQDTPQESLFVLRQSLQSLKVLVDQLLRLDSHSFTVYAEFGNLALREIVQSRFFRPARPLEFRLEYDRIKAVGLLDGLRRLEPDDRKLFSVAVLGLARLMRYLTYLPEQPAGAEAPPRRLRAVSALVRNETVFLAGFLETELASRANRKRLKGAALKASRALSRVVRQVPSSAAPDEVAAVLPPSFRAVVAAQLVLLAQAIDPDLGKELSSEQLADRPGRVARLRTDLWVFAELCKSAASAVGASEDTGAAASLEALHLFVDYFLDGSYQLLRAADFEPFDRFIGMLYELAPPPRGPAARARLSDDCHAFSGLLKTTFAGVSRRSEVGSAKFDLERAKALAAHFRDAAAR